MINVGFDPGLEGAYAVITDSGFAGVYDIPVNRTLRCIDGQKLRIELGAALDDSNDLDVRFTIEDVRYLPGSKAGGFGTAAMMLSKGIIQGVISSRDYWSKHVQFVDAKKWQALYGIKGGAKGKRLSLQAARNLYPDLAHMLARVMDNNRADALLIAHWAKRSST